LEGVRPYPDERGGIEAEGMTPSNLNGSAGVAELVELDRKECLRLLATGVIGRIVFTDAAMPAAHPVNYLLDGEEVLFRTADGRTFAATHRTVVGFQADDLDPETHTGWSVLGVGHAYEVVDPARLHALHGTMPESWAPGRAGHVVAVPLQHLTGRRLLPSSTAGDAPVRR
jgi:nitroimidazol reductase NimA-like FMN-containing flavoprotein (pyridoxamine 5'-phosphate oxidase superfamily)